MVEFKDFFLILDNQLLLKNVVLMLKLLLYFLEYFLNNLTNNVSTKNVLFVKKFK